MIRGLSTSPLAGEGGCCERSGMLPVPGHPEVHAAGVPRRMCGRSARAVALRGSVALASWGEGKWDETDSAARQSACLRRAGVVRGYLSRAPRSFRSFAQYSSRFLISRSKPRSGGS